jgi:pyruvyltransferase
MKPIKLYWWRPKVENKINLGDEINSKIVEAVSGRSVIRSSVASCDLLAIGSVLTFPQDQKVFPNRKNPIHVWGSGLIEPTGILPEILLQIAAVRGPLTRSFINVQGRMPVGDPGLFTPEVWPKKRERQFEWGIIAHHQQMTSEYIKRLHLNTPKSIIIDFTDSDIDQTLTILNSCEKIVSTSLHGLILADAYRIPNVWLNFKDVHRGRSWKFFDYFSSVGRVHFNSIVTPLGYDLHNVSDDAFDIGHFNRLDRLLSPLRSCFPAID